MPHYLISGNTVRIIAEEAINVKTVLPLGTYTVEINPMSQELFLQKAQGFDKPTRVYGEAEKHSDRIIKTFESRAKNTGVLLNGEKGSGKTFLAKYISWKLYTKGYSTILINAEYNTVALSQLIQTISEPCLIIFDEFEKVYSKNDMDDEKDPQNGLLTLLDGLLVTKKLFIFTCNDEHKVSGMMQNRPGRIFYNIAFGGLSTETVEMYCKEKLTNDKHLKEILNMKKLFGKFTFDMLQALVEEVNRYDENPLEVVKLMNIIPTIENQYYHVAVTSAIDNTKYCTNMDADSEGLWANAYNTRVASLYIWEKPTKTAGDDDEAEEIKKIRINIGINNMIEQDGNVYTYLIDKTYKVVLTLNEGANNRSMWRFADPYMAF